MEGLVAESACVGDDVVGEIAAQALTAESGADVEALHFAGGG